MRVHVLRFLMKETAIVLLAVANTILVGILFMKREPSHPKYQVTSATIQFLRDSQILAVRTNVATGESDFLIVIDGHSFWRPVKEK